MEKVPVLFLIFKRKEAVKAFESIRSYQPTRLYIAADGPRQNVDGERNDCESTRKTVLEMIDWPCDVKTLFRDRNLGCTEAVYGGISWFFENEKYGIINEDDVVISSDFFKMCEQLLPLYENEKQIMMISSRNHSGKYLESDEYAFVYSPKIWGWASWERAWKLNTNTFEGWSQFPKYKLVKRYGLFQGLVMYYHYRKCLNPHSNFFSWDYIWAYIISKYDGLVICPKVNLSTNVGIGVEGSTNFSENDEDPYASLGVGRLKWPLIIKKDMTLDKELLRKDRKDYFRIRMIGIKKKIFNILH